LLEQLDLNAVRLKNYEARACTQTDEHNSEDQESVLKLIPVELIFSFCIPEKHGRSYNEGVTKQVKVIEELAEVIDDSIVANLSQLVENKARGYCGIDFKHELRGWCQNNCASQYEKLGDIDHGVKEDHSPVEAPQSFYIQSCFVNLQMSIRCLFIVFK